MNRTLSEYSCTAEQTCWWLSLARVSRTGLLQQSLSLCPTAPSTLCLAGGLQPHLRLSPEEAAHQDFCFCCVETAICPVCPLHKCWCSAGLCCEKPSITADLQKEPKVSSNIGVTGKQIILTQNREDFLKKKLTKLPAVVLGWWTCPLW